MDITTKISSFAICSYLLHCIFSTMNIICGYLLHYIGLTRIRISSYWLNSIFSTMNIICSYLLHYIGSTINIICNYLLYCADIDSLYKCEGSNSNDRSNDSQDKGSSKDTSNDSQDKGSSKDTSYDSEEEESYEIEEEIEETNALLDITRKAIKLDQALPSVERGNNRHLKELRNDPLVQENLQGSELKPENLVWLERVLEGAKARSIQDLAEANATAAREKEFWEEAMGKGKGIADDKGKGKRRADDNQVWDDYYRSKRRFDDNQDRVDGPSNWRRTDDNQGRVDGPSNLGRTDDNLGRTDDNLGRTDDNLGRTEDNLGRTENYKGKGKGRADDPSNSRFHESENNLNNKKDNEDFSDYKQDESPLGIIIDIIHRIIDILNRNS